MVRENVSCAFISCEFSLVNLIQHNLKINDILIKSYEKDVTWSHENFFFSVS